LLKLRLTVRIEHHAQARGQPQYRIRPVAAQGEGSSGSAVVEAESRTKELKRTERIIYCQHVGETGEKLFQAADQLGLEGVIGKKADSPYRAGRTPNWVKVKTAHGRHIDEERATWNE
jgi:hypothetical protein